jgi:hypothetical protein
VADDVLERAIDACKDVMDLILIRSVVVKDS